MIFTLLRVFWICGCTGEDNRGAEIREVSTETPNIVAGSPEEFIDTSLCMSAVAAAGSAPLDCAAILDKSCRDNLELTSVDIVLSADDADTQTVPSVEESFAADTSARHGYVAGKSSTCWHVTELDLTSRLCWTLLLHLCVYWSRSLSTSGVEYIFIRKCLLKQEQLHFIFAECVDCSCLSHTTVSLKALSLQK